MNDKDKDVRRLSVQSVLCAEYVLNDLRDKGAAHLYEQYLDEKMPFFFAEVFIRQHFHNLQAFYSLFDPHPAPSLEDLEPTVSLKDNWRKMAAKMEHKEEPSLHSKTTTEQSEQTQKPPSKPTPTGRIKSAFRLQSKTFNKKEPWRVHDQKVTPNVAFRIATQTKELDQHELQQEEEEKRLRSEREAKIAMREKEEKRLLRKQQQENDKLERIKNTEKLLHNRQYTYDYNGKYIFVKGLTEQNSTLLQEQRAVDMKVLPQGLVDMGEQWRAKQDRHNAILQHYHDRFLEEDKAKMHAHLEQDLALTREAQDILCQPPQEETVQPNTGVQIVFENGTKKEGPPKNTERRMNKEQYLSQIKRDVISHQSVKLSQMNSHPSDDEKKAHPLQVIRSHNQTHCHSIQAPGQAVSIQNNQEYYKMLAQEHPPPEPVPLKRTKTAKSSRAVRPLRPQSNYERVTHYIEVADLNETSVQPVRHDRSTVDCFNQKEIIHNPSWGQHTYAPVSPRRTESGMLFKHMKKPGGSQTRVVSARGGLGAERTRASRHIQSGRTRVQV